MPVAHTANRANSLSRTTAAGEALAACRLLHKMLRKLLRKLYSNPAFQKCIAHI